ncbi:hypothetical protein PAECIP111894_01051 [Paenibacillus pseudetheri]|uniref:Uncharacterized protein n=1 Tax=Paenibacillus pseudetheri TaxID=2897682 RepID=A0ABM9B8A5_9BACL|nr:hypothetical protein PAECIP111894_01051 [Paenibacillus pseudetheri]
MFQTLVWDATIQWGHYQRAFLYGDMLVVMPFPFTASWYAKDV